MRKLLLWFLPQAQATKRALLAGKLASVILFYFIIIVRRKLVSTFLLLE